MEKKPLFPKGTFSLGINYWASHAATRMWTQWDANVVERDLQALSALGCTYLRVFPLWSDFQPIMILRANCFKGGYKRGYAFTGERPLPNTEAGRAGVDETMMERFETLCDLAQKYRLRVIVPLLNGHMTFRIYNPPALDGLDHFRDPESLMWQGKFLHYFVRRMKHHPAICAWEIGNESNCLSAIDDRAGAWTWTAFVTDAIRAEDQSRPVCSGMHSLQLHESRDHPAVSSWTFADQAELCDVLTAHPYPMWRGYVNCDRPNTLRWVYLTPTETQLYADISGAESFAEEVGTLRRTFSTFEALGDNLRNVLWLMWSHDARALLWWCAFDQTGMEFPPYDWDEAGMEHGVLTTGYQCNPTGRALADFAAFYAKAPIKALPPKRERAVCILGRDQTLNDLAVSVNLLAAQAGFGVQFTFCESAIPDAKLYLIPCVRRKGGLNRAAYRTLREKAENGATVYLSFDENVCIPEMEAFFGFEIANRQRNPHMVSLQIAETGGIPLRPAYRFTMLSHGATPLDPEELAWEYRVGKGRIVVLALPLETLLLAEADSYQTHPAYTWYQWLGSDLIAQNLLKSPDCEVTVSEHPADTDTVYAIVCNCAPAEKQIALSPKDGWYVASCHSDVAAVRYADGIARLPANTGALLVLKKREKTK